MYVYMCIYMDFEQKKKKKLCIQFQYLNAFVDLEDKKSSGFFWRIDVSVLADHIGVVFFSFLNCRGT
jgi:hypothetical protein